MGLDQIVFAVKQAPSKPVDFEQEFEVKDLEELHSWRKHPDLHGWMQSLYREKGGKDPDFNCVPVVLGINDIDRLETAVKNKRLPTTSGVFFGHADGSEIDDDLLFVRKARRVLAEGFAIFYTSWW